MKVIVYGDFHPRNSGREVTKAGKYESLFSEVKAATEAYDYRIANLEYPIVMGDAKPIVKDDPCIKCGEECPALLDYAHFDSVTLANNHFRDYGDQGVSHTLRVLDNHGIDHVGGGVNIDEASRIFYKKIGEETLAIIKENAAVHHVGVKRGDDLVAEYAAADCFVFPSYREGFPNTVLEAGAMGLPSIVTDINGSREIIVEKFRVESGECRDSSEVESFKSSDIKHQTSDIRLHRNGIIVPPRDEEALYAAMERMVTDKEMRESMAAKARPLIAERFEQGFVRRCLYEFYEEISHRNH